MINDEMEAVNYSAASIFICGNKDQSMAGMLRLRESSYSSVPSAVERGGAPGGDGLQDGPPRRLPARGVRPDEAVLEPGLGGAALLPHAEGKAAAYQSQGALPVKGEATRVGWVGGGGCDGWRVWLNG